MVADAKHVCLPQWRSMFIYLSGFVVFLFIPGKCWNLYFKKTKPAFSSFRKMIVE
jgi:hypothetical protein